MSRQHPTLTGDAKEEAIIQAARCKASRAHRLEPIPSDPKRRPSFGSLVTYRCELCGTLRLDIVSRLTGDVLTRSYDPPEWYAESNIDGHDPAWWRSTWWEQLDAALFLDAEPGGHVAGKPADAALPRRTKRTVKPSGKVVPIRRRA